MIDLQLYLTAEARMAKARRGRDRPMLPHADTQALATCVPTPTNDFLPEGFETEAKARAEDELRADRITRVLNRPGRTTWLNIGDRTWLAFQRLPHLRSPPIDREHGAWLSERLMGTLEAGTATPTLASSQAMRTIRMDMIGGLTEALAPFPDDELRTVTICYSGWAFTPQELDNVTAKQISRQLLTHLNRAGVTKVEGPLIAFLHADFEPKSGIYRLHYHAVTTAAKAAALMQLGLYIKGYRKTPTGSAPIRRSIVRSRARQFSYLLKAFWPSKAVRLINGEWKRDRVPHRIPEPFGTQVLLWLDRQKLGDLTVMNGCWSKVEGGPKPMQKLYSIVHGR